MGETVTNDLKLLLSLCMPCVLGECKLMYLRDEKRQEILKNKVQS